MAKMIEVDELEWQNAVKLRDTVNGMLSKSPSTRRKLLESQKEAFPDVVIPELDAAKPVIEVAEAVRKELADFKKEQEERYKKEQDERLTNDRSAKWEAGRNRLLQEGLKAVEDLMVKKGIADHDDGRIIFEKLNPPATPAVSSGGSGPWGFMDQQDETLDKNFKALIESKGNDERALNNLINSALNEARGAAPVRR
jgi:hypothetical protein